MLISRPGAFGVGIYRRGSPACRSTRAAIHAVVCRLGRWARRAGDGARFRAMDARRVAPRGERKNCAGSAARNSARGSPFPIGPMCAVTRTTRAAFASRLRRMVHRPLPVSIHAAGRPARHRSPG